MISRYLLLWRRYLDIKVSSPVEKIRKTRIKKDPSVKKPSFTKKQRRLIKLLDEGGYASLKQVLHKDKPRIQVSDQHGNSKEYVHPMTVITLVKRKVIFKSTDGKYYSVKYTNTLTDEPKPVPATNNTIRQGEFNAQGQTFSDHYIKREDPTGDDSKV